MAQRGGSVMNHIWLGCEYGPLVPAGGVDVFLALEPAEALRYAHYLSKNGIAIVNTYPVHPTTVTTGQFTYPLLEEILTPIQKIYNKLKTIDATKLAVNAGNPEAMNVVVLGALSKYMPLREDELIEALSASVPAKFLEVYMRAFELGKRVVSGLPQHFEFTVCFGMQVKICLEPDRPIFENIILVSHNLHRLKLYPRIFHLQCGIGF
jgi:indolepyruvate ferredoxin oxidoreductase beta subunit